MYYRGGWGNQSVGVATSKTGLKWKKYEHNPVYGGGGSNVSRFDTFSVVLPIITFV